MTPGPKEPNQEDRDRMVALFCMQPMPEGTDWSMPEESESPDDDA